MRGAELVRIDKFTIEEAAQALFEEYRGKRHHSEEATNKQIVRLENAILEELKNNPKAIGLRFYRELKRFKEKRAKVPFYKTQQKNKHKRLMKHIDEMLPSLKLKRLLNSKKSNE